MVSTLISENPKGQFYQAYQPFKDADIVELCPGCSDVEMEVVIRSVYRQVMGNAHVMESERLVVAESRLKRGELSVREFVRLVAKSELYRSRFSDNCYRYRAIELNYKHLLGRAPDNFDEMRYHSNVLDQSGFEADIDSYLDGDEYQNAFGENIVPYYRGYRTQSGQSMLEFTNMLQLLRSASSSDKNLTGGNKPQLTRAIIQNSPYGKMKYRDVNDILSKVFVSTSATASPQVYPAIGYPAPALSQQFQDQTQLIATLQKQLADLRPFAALGASSISSDWQPTSGVSGANTAQATEIASLREQIADAQRYAAIGESRLNKWRSRTFNS
jgi:phycoerythrin-associated linker protein